MSDWKNKYDSSYMISTRPRDVHLINTQINAKEVIELCHANANHKWGKEEIKICHTNADHKKARATGKRLDCSVPSPTGLLDKAIHSIFVYRTHFQEQVFYSEVEVVKKLFIMEDLKYVSPLSSLI